MDTARAVRSHTSLVVGPGLTRLILGLVPAALGGSLNHPVTVAVLLGAVGWPIWRSDVAERRIPSPWVYAGLAWIAAALLVAAATGAGWRPALMALGGAGVLGVVHLVVHLVSPAALGFGDVRLATLVGSGVAGVTGSLTPVIVVGLLAPAAAALVALHRRGPVPYAGYLLGSAVAVVALTVIVGVVGA